AAIKLLIKLLIKGKICAFSIFNFMQSYTFLSFESFLKT
ncbi:MAG: hypothetical protein ACI9XO_003505, partial [Paraglaciecola sp.]